MAVLLAVRDLVFRSKIEAAAQRVAVAVAVAPRGQPLVEAVRALGPRAVVADLGEPGAIEALRSVRELAPDLRIIGFFGHVREDLAEAARALGAEVYTRGQLSARLDELLSRGRTADPPRSPA
jgi:DNA-binding NarL/FixJ family response regulator